MVVLGLEVLLFFLGSFINPAGDLLRALGRADDAVLVDPFEDLLSFRFGGRAESVVVAEVRLLLL